jgi:hypothetical protein
MSEKLESETPSDAATCSACVACGSTEDSYFSRIDPMGYFCPDCGHEEGKPFEPKKPNYGIVGDWIAVADEMPDDEITVLVWVEGLNDATMAYHDAEVLERRGDTGWVMAGASRALFGVTHWCGEIRQPNHQQSGR